VVKRLAVVEATECGGSDCGGNDCAILAGSTEDEDETKPVLGEKPRFRPRSAIKLNRHDKFCPRHALPQSLNSFTDGIPPLTYDRSRHRELILPLLH
jgi:hypothetical protein